MPEVESSIRELLEGRHYATLATQNDDGSIHLTPVWYLFEDSQFFVATSSSSRKARNLRAHPTASLLVDIRKPGAERWVSGSGPAEILKGQESKEINAKIHGRYLTEEARIDPRIGPVFATADDVTLCIRPKTWRSWDAMDLDARFFGGILTRTPEKWFLPVD